MFFKAAHEYANIGLLRDPLFWGARMRPVIGILLFVFFLKKLCFYFFVKLPMSTPILASSGALFLGG